MVKKRLPISGAGGGRVRLVGLFRRVDVGRRLPIEQVPEGQKTNARAQYQGCCGRFRNIIGEHITDLLAKILSKGGVAVNNICMRGGAGQHYADLVEIRHSGD